jgi:hypothetical protein
MILKILSKKLVKKQFAHWVIQLDKTWLKSLPNVNINLANCCIHIGDHIKRIALSL